jgi:DNA topoisomerase VI subunit B
MTNRIVENRRRSTTLNRTTFRTSRLLDFCSRKELIAQTGHQPQEWPLVVLKELMDNALDACEEAGIAPAIDVDVGNDYIAIRDNGPGIPPDTVASVLDFGVRVSSREAYVAPTRGAQGNALKTLVAMPFVLDPQNGGVEVVAQGIRHTLTLRVDRIRQQPVTDHRQDPVEEKNGTFVRVAWPVSASSILSEARARFLQLADDYRFLNPHLSLQVAWGGEEISRNEATASGWGKWLPSTPTCPHWYSPAAFERLVGAYIAADADGGADRTVRELVKEFRGLTSTAKQKAVLDATGLARTNLSALAEGGEMRSDVIVTLLAAMKMHSRAVKPADLGVIGKEHLRARLEALGCEMGTFYYSKALTKSDDGLPTVLETAFAWRGDDCEESRRLVTGVNWSPGIVNPFRQLGTAGRSLDGVLEQQRAGRDEPVVLVLHLACPRVEYTDRGKSAVVAG